MAALKTIKARITPKPSPIFFPSVSFISFSPPLRVKTSEPMASGPRGRDRCGVFRVAEPLSPRRRGFRPIRHLARFFDVQHMQEPVIQFVDSEDHGPDRAAQG